MYVDNPMGFSGCEINVGEVWYVVLPENLKQGNVTTRVITDITKKTVCVEVFNQQEQKAYGQSQRFVMNKLAFVERLELKIDIKK